MHKLTSQEPKIRQYVIRKYIIASSMREAIRKERGAAIEGVFIDPDWKEIPKDNKIGFIK